MKFPASQTAFSTCPAATFERSVKIYGVVRKILTEMQGKLFGSLAIYGSLLRAVEDGKFPLWLFVVSGRRLNVREH